MSKIQRPLNEEAVRVANERLWAAHPELNRRQLTMGPEDAAYRQEWARAYQEELARQQGGSGAGGNPPGGNQPVGSPSAPCPGTTTADLAVHVTDQRDGSPVHGATVEIQGPTNRTGTTDANGNVTFQCVEAGAYTVNGSKTNYDPGTTTATVTPGTTSTAQVDLLSQTELVVTVKDQSNGSPIQGATVTITGPQTATGTTDAAGNVSFRAINTGDYRVRATAAGFRAAETSANVQVGTTHADLQMTAVSGLSGVVMETGTTTPIEGATVTLTRGLDRQTFTTGADGIYRFPDLTPDTYQLRATKQGYQDGTATAVVQPQSSQRVDIFMQSLLAINIAAVQASYVVVLDRSGNIPTSGTYPILEFRISGGPPNHLFDVQVARDSSAGLTGGPGLTGAWNSGSTRQVRQGQTLFSSWSNGERTLALDASGAATYRMPLEWWRDLARIPRASFTTAKQIFFRVLAFPNATSAPVAYSTQDGQQASAPHVDVQNNLVSMALTDGGYTSGGVAKPETVAFTVREANTTEMYTIVQWMQGAFELYAGPGAPTYPGHTLYAINHDANFPVNTVDSLTTNPRPSFFGGAAGPTVSADGLTASGTDNPNAGNISAAFTHYWTHVDFETRVHLNFEVPAAVNITRQDGSAPRFGVLVGVVPAPEPMTLASDTWNMRILQVRNAATGAVTITHPATFAGP